ncbi:Smr/MutS family protein [Orrella sp. JC864]|uniref:Smr/MutS family protein n=1 Tax=Orrella sp. JC864 TaxID=3120298 RepID=UPI003008C785
MKNSKQGFAELKALQKQAEENRRNQQAAARKLAAPGPAAQAPQASAFTGKAPPEDAAVFRQAMGAVTPIRSDRVARAGHARPPSDEQLRRRAWAMGSQEPETPKPPPEVSDEYVARLLTDEGNAFVRTGMAPDTLRKLRRGYWSVRTELDLHGMTLEQARPALARFLQQAAQEGLRCVRVIHGQGHNSPGEPVLRDKVTRWLVQHAVVLAFAQGKAADGGEGSVRVLLRDGGAADME